MTMEGIGDRDGALAGFYERHVADAVRGSAWLVIRDRARGLVSVMNAQRRVVSTTDALVGAARQ